MKDIKAMGDRELAEFQASYKQATAEWRLCEQEFIRRQGMPAARRSWIAIYISLGALGSSALSILITYLR